MRSNQEWAVLTGWRPRAGEIRNEKEQVIVASFWLEERGGAPQLIGRWIFFFG